MIPGERERTRLRKRLKRQRNTHRPSIKTVQHLGGAKIRFHFPCGHYRTEIFDIGPRGVKIEASEEATARMVRYWQNVGAIVKPCKVCQRKSDLKERK